MILLRDRLTTVVRKVVLGLVFSGLLASAGRAQPRESIGLDNMWDFATDPDNRGEAEKWYQPGTRLPEMPRPGYAPAANGKIRVPGIWDAQGYGVETDKVRHHFAGKGWYRRQIEIPQRWAGRKVFLSITGVSRYAKTWIDGQLLGEHIGCLSVAEYDVTRHATPGRTATVVIQVDSKQRWEVDSMYGALSLADYMDVPWGGIWGHVQLEARSEAWLSDLYLDPNVLDSSCSASAVVNGKTDASDRVRLRVFDLGGRCVAEAGAAQGTKTTAGQVVGIKVRLDRPQLWTPDTPTLYTARLELLTGKKVIDAVESRFGMRQFAVDGYRLLLNGKRIMLRGYGDDHIYPEQMAMPSDKELHRSRLKLIKSYGFNHVRHHSTIMPPEYYEACDELGIIATAEFPIAYAPFVPGAGGTWKSHVPPGTDPAPALQTSKREWEAAIKRHRNHPSILCWVRGNELYDETTFREDFFRIARQADPGRLYVDTDGIGIDVLDPKKDRETLGLYFIQFAEWDNPVGARAKYATPRPNKPVISHETANYVTFSRLDLADQFQHAVKPFWLMEGKARLAKLGLLEEAHRWAENSERLYSLLHKHNLEQLRKNAFLSGYHWWLFQDYWTSSNGIVDHYFRPKSITAEDVLRVNDDIVLLEDGLERTYRGRSRLDLKLLVSNFSPEAIDGEVGWEVRVGKQSLARQRSPLGRVPQGEVSQAAKIGLELPETPSPAKVTIIAELTTGARRVCNDWSTWLYPASIRPASTPVPIFSDDAEIDHCRGWGVLPIPTRGKLDERAVYLVSWLDKRTVDALQRGAGVVLLDGALQVSTTRALTYKTTWWKAGESSDANHCGTLVYDHPVTRAMAPDGWCDDGWFHLIDGGCKAALEKMPARPDVIIRGLPSLALIDDSALLYEVSVGKGTLIVSGLNHVQAKGRPENQWIIARLLDRAAAFPRPKPQWPASALMVELLAPDGCLPGFRRLVSNEGEDGVWYSYRENGARVIVCRQSQPGHRVAWDTGVLPNEHQGERATFVFAGGLGYSSEPKTEGFALEINGKEALRFDLPEPRTWTSADRRIELRMDVRRVIGPDYIGLFFLTVPRDLLKPGEPCRLGVRSLGTGSQRWFGLNPYLSTR